MQTYTDNGSFRPLHYHQHPTVYALLSLTPVIFAIGHAFGSFFFYYARTFSFPRIAKAFHILCIYVLYIYNICEIETSCLGLWCLFIYWARLSFFIHIYHYCQHCRRSCGVYNVIKYKYTYTSEIDFVLAASRIPSGHSGKYVSTRRFVIGSVRIIELSLYLFNILEYIWNKLCALAVMATWI